MDEDAEDAVEGKVDCDRDVCITPCIDRKGDGGSIRDRKEEHAAALSDTAVGMPHINASLPLLATGYGRD